MAMASIDELEAYHPGGDAIQIATKFVTLAQVLSDLGLHNYALDTLQRPYTAEPVNAHLHVASVLSLQANILCDLKKNDEANDAAERAAMLCREHKDSQTAPILTPYPPRTCWHLLIEAHMLCTICLAVLMLTIGHSKVI